MPGFLLFLPTARNIILQTILKMKKLLLAFTVLTGLSVSAQKNNPKKFDLSNRPKDHLMIQYGSDSWSGKPDSVRTGGGFSRHFNIYFMLDKPFKTNQKLSLGIGAGIGSSNIFFDNVNVNIKSTSSKLPFTIADSINHFNKFKLTSLYAQIPLEIRYYSNPENPAKSWKFAAGVKLGTLLKSYTKGKNLQNKSGQSVYGSSYIMKEYSKKFLNGTDIALTGRVGYGIISLEGSYNMTGVLKEGTGAAMNKYGIGISISGL